MSVFRSRSGRAPSVLAVSLVSLLMLTGCSLSPGSVSVRVEEGEGAETASSSGREYPRVPGYGPGEFPPVPLFALPDVRLLNSSHAAFAVQLSEAVGEYPGLRVEPASCDGGGQLETSGGGSLLYGGDGSGTYIGEDATTINNGDGSGSYVGHGATIMANGDGSGSYISNDVTIMTNGDGSGSYVSNKLTVLADGKGGGSYHDNTRYITVVGDGSGAYNTDTEYIVNGGDGSGTYHNGDIYIVNNGDGTGTINGESVDFRMEPLGRLPALGGFPPMQALAPIESCGVTITLESEVLFDFDQDTLRPEAQQVIASLTAALNDLNAPRAQIGGHTDSIGEDAYNQDLSQRRAQAVADALQAAGTRTSLEAAGYGETRPVAANEHPDGSDNPSGRQANRRVEIFIPAF